MSSTIVTLRLDPASQATFEALRRLHFPPERNHIPAHLTLFHTLPDTAEISAALHRAACGRTAFRLAVTGVRSLGRGVAYTLHAVELLALHHSLADTFGPHLSAQDRQPLRPHIVVQNKTTPDQARSLLAALQAGPLPAPAEAIGLDLWLYLGGPWQHRQTFPFAASL